jgi:hypothetical protein
VPPGGTSNASGFATSSSSKRAGVVYRDRRAAALSSSKRYSERSSRASSTSRDNSETWSSAGWTFVSVTSPHSPAGSSRVVWRATSSLSAVVDQTWPTARSPQSRWNTT